MKKTKKIVWIILGVILFLFVLKLYTEEVYKYAQRECQSSEIKYLKNKKIDFKSVLIDIHDKENYNKIMNASINNDDYNSLLLASILFANKWDSSDASYMAFVAIANLDSKNTFEDKPNLDFLDIETRNLAIHYLDKSAELGSSNAKFILGNYYLDGKYLKKDTLKGKKLIDEANQATNGLFRKH